ncbi:MAG: exodeoxyribonuclease VII large subunit, partial [SAR324 cluster bacterium]|nr:exodeoxyribonuclease VII large subunit [SAR324 cluster bacterium]
MEKIVSLKAQTVTELTRNIKHLLEDTLGKVFLQGEISNLARPNSGHLYFNIKDNNAQIAGVMFRSVSQRTRFSLENGLEVLLHGRITVYEPRGAYQLVVDRVEPVGSGALQLAFEQLKARLSAEGLFDAEHKHPLPFIPRGIGIVTSPTGAAIRDILNILGRRFPSIPVLINPVTVQGDTAAREIAAAIRHFQGMEEIDLLIVGRGGGSVEDLWAFNEEIVARAIFKSCIPVI